MSSSWGNFVIVHGVRQRVVLPQPSWATGSLDYQLATVVADSLKMNNSLVEVNRNELAKLAELKHTGPYVFVDDYCYDIKGSL
jgi:hypothetical protein